MGANQISDRRTALQSDDTAYLHLCTDGAGTRLAAVGACEASAAWKATARPGEVDAQLLNLAATL
ncbi:MAG: hypothetical protein ACOCX2_10720, partial [Armatimonadota bacterium]